MRQTQKAVPVSGPGTHVLLRRGRPCLFLNRTGVSKNGELSIELEEPHETSSCVDLRGKMKTEFAQAGRTRGSASKEATDHKRDFQVQIGKKWEE